MSVLLSPPRGRGAELLDAPNVDAALARRSLRDVAMANRLFGGTRAVLAELQPLWDALPAQATLLDVGMGRGDIPARARETAAAHGVCLRIIGLEASLALATTCMLGEGAAAVCGDARRLPFANRSIDVVTCSQVLHHFFDDEMRAVLAELHRVARVRVIVSDLERSRVAAAGIWLASFLLAFHPASRHDGVVSVMRGFRAPELRDLVRDVVGCEPTVCYRAGYRVTASWTPA